MILIFKNINYKLFYIHKSLYLNWFVILVLHYHSKINLFHKALLKNIHIRVYNIVCKFKIINRYSYYVTYNQLLFFKIFLCILLL